MNSIVKMNIKSHFTLLEFVGNLEMYRKQLGRRKIF